MNRLNIAKIKDFYGGYIPGYIKEASRNGVTWIWEEKEYTISRGAIEDYYEGRINDFGGGYAWCNKRLGDLVLDVKDRQCIKCILRECHQLLDAMGIVWHLQYIKPKDCADR